MEQILEEEDQESDPEAQGNLWSPVLEGILDGKTVDMASQGEIDLIDQKIDLTVVVAPQKTVDRVVKRIPGVRYILGGTLISYPVRVRGDITAPKVSALSPSAVGSELLGIMERTFRLPVRIIQPLLPGKRKGQGAFQK